MSFFERNLGTPYLSDDHESAGRAAPPRLRRAGRFVQFRLFRPETDPRSDCIQLAHFTSSDCCHRGFHRHWQWITCSYSSCSSTLPHNPRRYHPNPAFDSLALLPPLPWVFAWISALPWSDSVCVVLCVCAEKCAAFSPPCLRTTLHQASRSSPPASAESMASAARYAPALTPTASSRQLVTKLEFAIVKVRTSVDIDASDEVCTVDSNRRLSSHAISDRVLCDTEQRSAECDLCFLQSPHSFQIRSRCQVEAKLDSAHRRYQRAMTKSKLEIQRFADAQSPSPLRDSRDSDSLPVTGVSAASAADILDVRDTTAFASDEEQEDDDLAADDNVASHPPLPREFTRIFEQSEIKASRPRFPLCPSSFDCSASAWAARRRLAYHLFESPRSSTLVSSGCQF